MARMTGPGSRAPAVDTYGRPGYHAHDRARGGAPGALYATSGSCEPESTPAACPRPHRATGDDAAGASPRAAEPCEPRQVGRSSGKRPAPGATRGLGPEPPPPPRAAGARQCVRTVIFLPFSCHTTTSAHGLLLRRADRPRSPPPHHTTSYRAGHLMKGYCPMMSSSTLPPHDAPPLCAVCGSVRIRNASGLWRASSCGCPADITYAACSNAHTSPHRSGKSCR